MKQRHRLIGLSSLLMSGSVMVMTVQPAWAGATQITSVQANPTSQGNIELILETQNGDRPQVFSVSRGNSWVADLTNTQLQLPAGNNFRQENPSPGISSIEIRPLDTNSIRVIVTGKGGTPTGQLSQRSDSGLVLSVAPAVGSQAAATPIAPANAPNAPANNPTNPVAQGQAGVQAQAAPSIPVRPQNPAPPLLPRAVAPPLGDIAISTVDSFPSSINLDSAERVPRLVVREASARDVLAALARAASLNIAYTDTVPTNTGAPGAAAPASPATAGGPKISLDVENESVQDVFNYVLRLSGLDANRVGRTIFVGPRLPDGARNVVSRTLRLNQVNAATASSFLSTLGAETAINVEGQPEIVTITIPGVAGSPGTTQTITRTGPPTIQPLVYTPTNGVAPLRGLQVTSNARLNSITIVGNPRVVEIATAYLSQLDLRRRQVSVNVKIIDINLANQQNSNASFSFGLNDGFISSDGGAASINFGGIKPPSSTSIANSLTSPPTITNPITGTPFRDPNNPVFVPSVGNVPGVLGPIPPNGNPLIPGITSIVPTTSTTTSSTPPVTTTTLGSVTYTLASLFQYPTKFLASLNSQVISGNAKILTDPTLTVQEGQSASVNLTQEVFAGIQQSITPGTNGGAPIVVSNVTRAPIGLSLSVTVERIDDNGFVTLNVSPTVSSVGGSFTAADGNTAILTATRTLNSGSIRMRDGQTLILAGIIQEQDRQSVTKVPILGDLPLIGALFRSNTGSNTRTEVIIVLTPQVLDDTTPSTANYGYTPSPDARQLLQRQ